MLSLLYTILCAALSGAAFYFSNGLGEIWFLAWIAPMPLLWLAYGSERTGRVALAAYVAYAAGQMNVVIGYWGQLPTATLFLILLVPPGAFALAILFGRFAIRRLHPYLAALAFPALWTTWEYTLALNSADGTAGSIAYSQAGVAEMIQTASLFGLFGITFLLTLNSSLLAMALRVPSRQSRRLALIALALFVANVLFGVARLHLDSPGEKMRVAMIASDALNDSAFSSEGVTALRTVHAYLSAAQGAIKSGAQVVVMPEKLAVIEPAWRFDTFFALQQAADRSKVTMIAGFDFRGDKRRNIALVVRPSVHEFEYDKRRLVPGLEDGFQPGLGPGVFAPGLAVAICKDMDFVDMIRADAQAHIRIMFVPAWDFGADGWAHARMAILRGVEGGYAVVRAARLGYLTATDARGRIIGGAPTTNTGFVSAVADVPLGPGDTVYLHIGDVLAWVCIVLTLGLFVIAFLPWRQEEDEPEADGESQTSET